ncbi:DUF4345 family protein [Vitreimonas flagellata]|uniref:DUF4345 family protein n=1 Tax=Vitreimonas flagellata TaxID=2560861 RepID=UPI0010757843|nr:DUF4345 family protein [Vitreimonas flagellata]
MKLVLRIVLGLAGLVFVVMGLAFWANPATPAARLGIEAAGALGTSSLRADMAAFFGVAGGLTLLAAVRANARLLTAPLLMIAIALTGRIITVIVDGYTPEMMQPMVIEAVLLALLAAGRRSI